jgi:hypothetical protein
VGIEGGGRLKEKQGGLFGESITRPGAYPVPVRPIVPPLEPSSAPTAADQVRILAGAVVRAIEQISKGQPMTARAILSVAMEDAQFPLPGDQVP